MAAAALHTWAIQAGAGLTVFPGGQVASGATFALVISLPAAGYVTAPGRVVHLIDEPGRAGFAYGTLPGHPEQGEEAFVVARAGDRLRFEIAAFSRPRHPLARLGGPVTRMLQVHVTRRYLAAMRRCVA